MGTGIWRIGGGRRARQEIAENRSAELHQKMFLRMAGPGTPKEKVRAGTRLREELQVAIRKLHGPA